MDNISSAEAKCSETQLSNAMHMCLEGDLDQANKSWRVTTLNELVYS